jgi:hypothetical protein
MSGYEGGIVAVNSKYEDRLSDIESNIKVISSKIDSMLRENEKLGNGIEKITEILILLAEQKKEVQNIAKSIEILFDKVNKIENGRANICIEREKDIVTIKKEMDDKISSRDKLAIIIFSFFTGGIITMFFELIKRIGDIAK